MTYCEALKHEFLFVINLKLQKKRTKHKMNPAVSTEKLNSLGNGRSRSLKESTLFSVNNKSSISNINRSD